MKKKLKYFLTVCLAGYLFLSVYSGIEVSAISNLDGDRPILVIIADKLDGTEFFNCKLPAIRRLLSEGACGLMNVRTGSGYTSDSGYLSLGTGNRSVSPAKQGGTFQGTEELLGGTANAYWNWSFGVSTPEKDGILLVPEIGWLINQAGEDNGQSSPGLLGTILHLNGWKTILIGNVDSLKEKSRPGGLLLMDQLGVVDGGNVGESINEATADFPYGYRFSASKVIKELKQRVALKSLIMVEFGDFARLDRYREEILPTQYITLKQDTWKRFDRFMGEVMQTWSAREISLILLSPSISKEGMAGKSLLAPVLIRAASYPPGLLTSGTTNWTGLVANIDFLPTVIKTAHLPPDKGPGRVMKSALSKDEKSIERLNRLNDKIIASTQSQRPLLDWYLGIITVAWIVGILFIFLKKGMIGNFITTFVATVPLSLLLLPLLPIWSWEVSGLLIGTSLISGLLMLIKNGNRRFLILSALLWSTLWLDQITGWSLIRFSALGYSSTAGARYYGMGNEYMGVFLAVSLIFSYLLNKVTLQRWPAIVVLGLSSFILGWPQLGANFGGLLGALPGFVFYLATLYNLRINNKKLWFSLLGCLAIVIFTGWWDSLRSPESQTHIGKFFHLVFTLDFNQIWPIFERKAEMNLKLMIFSPWTRIIILAGFIGMVSKIIFKRNFVSPDEIPVWRAVLISGAAAFLLNDSGVVALATCLAYGFSFMINNFSKNKSEAALHSRLFN